MSDFRKYGRPKRKRKRRTVRDTYMKLNALTQRAILQGLDKFFKTSLTT